MIFIKPFVYIHTSCVRTAKALTRLRTCAGSPEPSLVRLRRCASSPEPSLVAYVIRTIISWAGSIKWVESFNEVHVSYTSCRLVSSKAIMIVFSGSFSVFSFVYSSRQGVLDLNSNSMKPHEESMKGQLFSRNSEPKKNCISYILGQSHNAAVFYFNNISFLEHVLNQLFLSDESSISQASYRTTVLTICFQLFKKQTILWR